MQYSEREQKRILKESLRRLQSETAKQNTSFVVPSSKDVAPNCVGHQPPPPAKSGDERQPLQTKNGAGKAFDYKKYEEGSSSLAFKQNSGRKNCYAIKIGPAID